MEETAVLLGLAFVMLVGSFVAGSIPLFFTFSEVRFKFKLLSNLYLTIIDRFFIFNDY